MYSIVKLLIDWPHMKILFKALFLVSLSTPLVANAQFVGGLIQGLGNILRDGMSSATDSINESIAQKSRENSAIQQSNEDGKSIVEVKVMQTRLFEKPYYEISDAIMERYTNMDFTCRNGAPKAAQLYTPINVKSEIKGVKTLFSNGGFNAVTAEVVCRRMVREGNLEYIWALTPNEIKTPSKPTTEMMTVYAPNPQDIKATTVRLRIYGSVFVPNQGLVRTQFLEPENYQGPFKNLADALFVNAIEINPQLMK